MSDHTNKPQRNASSSFSSQTELGFIDNELKTVIFLLHFLYWKIVENKHVFLNFSKTVRALDSNFFRESAGA